MRRSRRAEVRTLASPNAVSSRRYVGANQDQFRALSFLFAISLFVAYGLAPFILLLAAALACLWCRERRSFEKGLDLPFNIRIEKRVETEEEFTNILSNSHDARGLAYWPATFEPSGQWKTIRDKKFIGCSFKDTTLVGVYFFNCQFEDCLFLSAEFRECEFTHCTFEGSNLHRAKFTRSRISPGAISSYFRPLRFPRYANIGVHVFQELLKVSLDEHQHEYAPKAYYYWKYWDRFNELHNFQKKRIGVKRFGARWVFNALHWFATGYGVKATRAMFSSFLLFLWLVIFNFLNWQTLGMVSQAELGQTGSWVEAVYFTLVSITTLGYGDIVPGNAVGQYVMVIETALGVLWLGVLASVVAKRVALH